VGGPCGKHGLHISRLSLPADHLRLNSAVGTNRSLELATDLAGQVHGLCVGFLPQVDIGCFQVTVTLAWLSTHRTAPPPNPWHGWPAEVGMTAAQVWACSAACIA
jgi:hypothetical protein